MKYLEIVTPLKEIKQMVNAEFATQLNKLFVKNKNRVVVAFKDQIKLWVAEQPEITSLSLGGQNSLAAMFGITSVQAQAAISDIINAVVDSFEISITKFDKNLDGVVEFRCQSDSFYNLLIFKSGHSYSKDKIDLHWLDWLLTKGDSVIIVGYSYVPSNLGISGSGTMKKGGSFRVPPQYSGNRNDNFITRAFNSREKQIEKILGGLLI